MFVPVQLSLQLVYSLGSKLPIQLQMNTAQRPILGCRIFETLDDRFIDLLQLLNTILGIRQLQHRILMLFSQGLELVFEPTVLLPQLMVLGH